MSIIMAIYEYWMMLHDVAIRWYTECPVGYMMHSITGMLAGILLWKFYEYIRFKIHVRKRLKEMLNEYYSN